ncbi:MAG: hypothetical protein SYR96_22900 [Actinomycetota bacterium]|nr:hypothetical protein [Actinomycetota bacterium]
MKSRLTGAIAALAAAALLATGCAGQKDDAGTADPAAPAAPAGNGVEALEAAQILEKAKAALTQAKSFHFKGSMKADEGKIGLDFKIAGEDVFGTMSLDGPKVQLLAVDGKKYIKPDAAFWKMSGGAEQGPVVAQLVGDRWVLVKAGDKSFEGMFSTTDVSELLEPEGTVTKGAVKDVDGKPAITLTDGGADGGTLYIATTGEPYPLKLEGPTPADGALTFTEFGETFADIKAPATADVVDLEKLKK